MLRSSRRFRQVNQSEVLGGGLPGEEPPEIDRQLPRHRHNRLLARGRTARVRPSPQLQPSPSPALQVDLLPLKSIGDGLYRLPGRKPAAVRAVNDRTSA